MNLVDEFQRMVEVGIDEEGIYPHPAMWTDADGKACIGALALGPEEAFKWFWNLVQRIRYYCDVLLRD